MCSSPPPCASTTARSSRPRWCSYASAYARGGLDALDARDPADAGDGPRRSRCSCAYARPRQERRLPEHAGGMARFDLSQLAEPAADRRADLGRRSTVGDGAVLEVASVRLPDGTLVPGRQEHRARGRSCSRASAACCSSSFASIVAHRPRGRRAPDLVGAAARARAGAARSASILEPGAPTRACRCSDTGDALGRAGRAGQRDARPHRRRGRRHAGRARQRGARPAHADDAAARDRRDGAASRTIPRPSRGAGRLPGGVRSRGGDAQHADGHLRSGDGHACGCSSSR